MFNSPTYTATYGGGLSFDGVDDYARAPVNLPLGANDPFTYEMWFEWVFTSSFKRIYATDGDEFDLAHGGNQTIAWYSPANGWNTPSVTTGGPGYYTGNTVYHYAVTYDGSTLAMYQNANLYYSATSVNIDVDPTYSWLSSNPGGGDYNTNTYYKIRTYSAALSGSDVTANFDAEKSNYGY